MPTKRQIPILVEPRQEQFLKRAAKEAGRSMADIVRVSIDHFATLADTTQQRLIATHGDAVPFAGGAPFREDRT